MKTWNIYQDLWHAEIKLVIGTIDEVNKAYSAGFSKYCSGGCASIEDNKLDRVFVLIFIRGWKWDAPHYRSLVHECLHAAHRILELRKVKFEDSEGEAHAYLQEWILRECAARLGRLEKQGKKKK